MKNELTKGENPLKGEVVINLGGESWPGLITLNSTMKIETATGMSITKLALQFGQGADITMSNVVVILKIITDESGKIVKPEAIQNAIQNVHLMDAINVIGQILGLIVMPMGSEIPQMGDDDEGNAPRKKRVKPA